MNPDNTAADDLDDDRYTRMDRSPKLIGFRPDTGADLGAVAAWLSGWPPRDENPDHTNDKESR